MTTHALTRSLVMLATLVAASACTKPASTQGYLAASVEGDLRYAELASVHDAIDREAACGPGGPTSAGRRDMPRWPYLQKVTTEGAEVLFTTTAAHSFRIVARTIDGELLDEDIAVADRDATPSRGTQYVASLRGLPVGEIVCYQLFAGDTAWTHPVGFRTAPSPDDEAPVRFLALGDLGTRSPDQYAVLDAMQTVPADFALLTGDIAYTNGTRNELENNFFGVYQSMIDRVPFFVASGNHDYNTEDARPFRDAFALFENGGPEGHERWYSFDWGPVHFTVLDTELLVPAQVQWLQADLVSHDRPWVIVVAHRPPFSSGSHGSDLAVREMFTPIFAAHHVPLVLLGHDHDYERTTPQDGVVYVVTGGGGRGTREVGESDFTAVADRVAHFLWLEADALSLRMVAVDATGTAFDSVAFAAS